MDRCSLNNMKISLIIPAHNEEKYIGECLRSILENTSVDVFEIIVVDNASTDKTVEIARKFSKVRVVFEPNKGLTHARQRGLNESRGDLIAYIDADVRISKRWFEILIEEFSASSDLVCLSGPCEYFDIPKWKNAIVKFYWSVLALPSYAFMGYMIIGGNFIAKKSALIKIGGFDTEISFYGEDTNIARRLSKVGKVKFLPKFFVYTSGRRFISEGFLTTGIKYVANYLSEVIIKKPITRDYKDIR